MQNFIEISIQYRKNMFSFVSLYGEKNFVGKLF